MGSAALKLPTLDDLYDELMALPEQFVGEIVAGELYASPRPGPRHARAASRISNEVGIRFDRRPGGGDFPGGWQILVEPELHLDSGILVPDLAGWRREKLPALPSTAYFEQAPDWVCEVVSPSTEKLDRGYKLACYAREGVSHLWLVYPLLQLVEVYRLVDGNWSRIACPVGNVEARLEPFEVMALDLSRLWEID